MMLGELLSDYADIIHDVEVTGLSLDSRSIMTGDAFFALSGADHHGMEFSKEAIRNGAVAVIYELDDMLHQLPGDSEVTEGIAVDHLAQKLGLIAARFFVFPAQHLSVIGITGTNGKTTCSQLLGQMLPDCGVIGTLGWGEYGRLKTTLNTTPDAISIQSMLREFVNQNKVFVAMEVSSHGLEQGRVNGLTFTGAVFTNISQDHLDYHDSMDAYLDAKLKLLDTPELGFVVVNLDDTCAQQILVKAPDSARVIGYTHNQNTIPDAHILSASNIEYSILGIECDLHFLDQKVRLSTSLVGDFNLENILAVVSVGVALGYSLVEAAEKLSEAKAVAGRLERLTDVDNLVQVFIDYAHTPDALQRVLKSLRVDHENKLLLVFGCGGDRDSGKRPLMGNIAHQLADQIVVTNDNPRTENAENIIADILRQCSSEKFTVIPDRAAAIRHVIENAKDKSTILIAGKGHEEYQEMNGQKIPFSDRQVAIDAISARGLSLC